MATLQADIANFTAAAAPYGSSVWVSRETFVFVREWLVANDWIQPGTNPDVSIYTAALGELVRQGTLPKPVKTAEELQLEEDRKNMGVIYRKDEVDKPSRKLDVYASRDKLAEHNAAADAALEARRNPAATRREQMDNLIARMDTGEAIPGLVDESEAGCGVYVGGRLARYATSQAVEKAKAHNARVRSEYAQRQAAAEAAKTPRGL